MLGKLKYAFTCNPIAQTLLEWTLESNRGGGASKGN